MFDNLKPRKELGLICNPRHVPRRSKVPPALLNGSGLHRSAANFVKPLSWDATGHLRLYLEKHQEELDGRQGAF
jgi:hypothetical protein